MAKIPMNDNFDLDKFDPYKDSLVTTVRGTEKEFREVLDKIMGDETNKIKRNTVSLRQKWISVKERMPQTEGKYIVCTAKGSVYCTKFKGCGDTGVFKADMNTHITHWMPLPEAPEVEDE